MQLRPLESGDEEDIRSIARRSMETVYEDVLAPEVIDRALEAWYSSDAIEEYRSGTEMAFVIAELDGRPVGFGQGHVVEALGKGRVLWVHVDPDHRGRGIGVDLLEALIHQFHERGIEMVTTVVLAEHDSGVGFYEANGFDPFANRTVKIGGEEFREVILREASAPPQPLELRVDESGDELYVDLEDPDRGSLDVFCPVYRDPDRERRYGWYCRACDSLETAMDTMGRIRCSQCDNTRKPTRWDAAYL